MTAARVVRFSVWDFVVFAVMLLFSVAIGVYHAVTGDKQRTTQQYLLANRGMMAIPIAISLLASFMSAITILGVPAEMYMFGTQYWLIIASYVILFPAVALVFVPVFRSINITSSYEYLERRFSGVVRTIGSLLFIIQTSLYMAIVLYAPSLALEAVTGFPIWVSILSIGVVCTFYTTIGGMKAVIWNDVFQAVVMLGGLVAVVIKGSEEVGGFGHVWDLLEKGDRLKFIDVNPDPTQRLSIWSLIIGGGIGLLPLWAVNQTAVQRFLAAKSDRDAQISVWINCPLSILAVSLCALCGCVIYAFYHDCDPITMKYITSADQILPYFVMHVLEDLHGLPGLFMACLFSGTLSTVSSGLNSLAAVVLQDIIKPFNKYHNKDLTDKRATLYSKCFVLAFGVLVVGLSFLATKLGAILQTFYRVFGVVGGPVVGAFCLGMLTRRAHAKGTCVGMLFGFAMGLWIGIGSQVHRPPAVLAPRSISGCTNSTFYNNTTPTPKSAPAEYDGLSLYKLSFLWYSAVCLGITFIVGLVVSVVFPGDHRPEDVDPRLLFHLRYALPCSASSSYQLGNEEIELNKAEDLEYDNKTEDTVPEEHQQSDGSVLMITSF